MILYKFNILNLYRIIIRKRVKSIHNKFLRKSDEELISNKMSVIYEIIAYFFMTKTEEKLLKRY